MKSSQYIFLIADATEVLLKDQHWSLIHDCDIFKVQKLFTRTQLDFYSPQHHSQHTNSFTVSVTQPSQQLQSSVWPPACLNQTPAGWSNASKIWETKKMQKSSNNYYPLF